ncbi:MAG: hypothetical protein O6941_00640 [Planctomycetota bacterium]|nr:hypothetical protein [Planctomycetota bacterium]
MLVPRSADWITNDRSMGASRWSPVIAIAIAASSGICCEWLQLAVPYRRLEHVKRLNHLTALGIVSLAIAG